MSKVIVRDHWRHFTPVAPDIEVTVYQNTLSHIDIRQHLIQGAKDQETHLPDLGIIAGTGAQRGWRLNYFALTQPKRGYVTISNQTLGFSYLSSPEYTGTDCFDYILSVNGQHSLPGKIHLTVKRWFTTSIKIENKTGTNVFRYKAITDMSGIAADLGTGWVHTYKWYQYRPVKKIGKLGRPEIHIVRTLFASSEVEMYYVFRVINRRATSPDTNYTYPNPYFEECFDGTSLEPYRQLPGPYPVELETTFRRNPIRNISGAIIRFEETHTITTNVTTQYGRYNPNWWKSGTITYIEPTSW